MNKLTQEELSYLIGFVEKPGVKNWHKAKHDLSSDAHPDTIRKSFNGGRYSGYSVAKYYQDLIKNGLEDEEISRLDEKIEKEYKERVKLQTVVREQRKMLREKSKIEMLQEYIDLKVESREQIEFSIDSMEIASGNEASLLVSDLHCGMVVDSVFNYYDIEVLREKMEQLASKTIKFCKSNNVTKLHVEMIGDLISGIIHNSLIAQSEEDVIDQVFCVGDLLVDFLISLRDEIPEVIGYVTYGNHGRTSSNKTDSPNKTNFERLVAPFIRKSLSKTDIKIKTNGNEDFVPYKLNDGRLIVATHGTRDSLATVNANFTKLLKEEVFEVHMGHFHEYKEANGAVINGSVIGSDDYAIGLRKNSNSIQILKVYYSDGDIGAFQLILN